MNSSRREFIKQSSLATIATLGLGSLLWSEIGNAQDKTAAVKLDTPSKVNIPEFLKNAPALAGANDF